MIEDWVFEENVYTNCIFIRVILTSIIYLRPYSIQIPNTQPILRLSLSISLFICVDA